MEISRTPENGKDNKHVVAKDPVLGNILCRTSSAVKKVLPGLALLAGCASEPLQPILPVAPKDHATDIALHERIDTTIKEIDTITKQKELTERAEEQDKELNTSTTQKVESTIHYAGVLHQEEPVQEVHTKIRPKYIGEGVDVEHLRTTAFGKFYEAYIRSYPVEDQEKLLQVLTLVYHFEHNGTYLPYINKELLRDGIRATIDFETVLPRFSRDEVVPYVMRAAKQFEEYTGIPVEFVENAAEANMKIGLVATKYGMLADKTWIGVANIKAGQEYTEGDKEIDMKPGVNHIQLFFDWDPEPHIQKIYEQKTFLALLPLEQEKIRLELAQITKEDIILRRVEGTVIHEFIHSLGIGHAEEDSLSIMHPHSHVDYLPEIGKEGEIIRSLILQKRMDPENIAKDPLYVLIKALKAYVDQQK